MSPSYSIIPQARFFDVKAFQRDEQTGRARVIKKAALVLLLLLLIAASLAAFLYFHWSRKPRPTAPDWSAVVVTLAGDGAPGFRDGLRTEARFANVFGIAVDRAGNVFVSDAGDTNRIRKITPEGLVSTLAGGGEGFSDGLGAAASFNTPSALTIDTNDVLYVADTGNNSIRKIMPDGTVTTLAGNGEAGHLDGQGRAAQFNGPVGIAVDTHGNVYVADSYNDRIRKVTPDGFVTTIAGGQMPGYRDGPALDALFDTPCAVAVASTGELFIADTGNNRIRKITSDGQVATFSSSATQQQDESTLFAAPIGLALTHDGFLYVLENWGGRIVQLSPEGAQRTVAGSTNGFANGEGTRARFNSPMGIAVERSGALYVADAANYMVRKLVSTAQAKEAAQFESNALDVVPRLDAETLGASELLPWPVDPQREWHEVIATMGEVRGNHEGESRDHLHSGIDVQGNYGATVRAVRDEKVNNPLSNWQFDSLNEGLRVGLMTYIHLRVGRNQKNESIDPTRFVIVRDEQNMPARVRVKRGTRFRVGDPLGTINRMYHVHLNFGPGGGELNPLALGFVSFSDHVAPRIEPDGIQLYDQTGARLTEKRDGRLVVRRSSDDVGGGDVSIVVDAFDQVDRNLARRRLGLYKLGYQILQPDGTPAPGFEQPRITIEFNRLSSDPNAVTLAYADASGITVYGSKTTRFLYNITNTVRDGHTARSVWRASELPPGPYTLRIFAADYSGNEVTTGRDLPIVIQ